LLDVLRELSGNAKVIKEKVFKIREYKLNWNLRSVKYWKDAAAKDD
jgi:hypothetical protein